AIGDWSDGSGVVELIHILLMRAVFRSLPHEASGRAIKTLGDQLSVVVPREEHVSRRKHRRGLPRPHGCFPDDVPRLAELSWKTAILRDARAIWTAEPCPASVSTEILSRT